MASLTRRSDSVDERTWRQCWLLPVLVCTVAVQSLVSSLGAPLVPLISREYDVALSTAQWALTASLLAGAVATPLLGRFADLGRERTVLLAAVCLVIVGGVLAAMPGGVGVLLAGRALQGVGLALTPIAMSIARSQVAPAKLAGAIAALSVAVVTGSALSQPVVAAIAQAGGLHAAIWSAVAVTVVVLVAAYLVVPADTGPADPTRSRSVDWVGAALLAIATVAALLALTEGPTWGWSSPWVMGLFVVAVVVGYSWIRHGLSTESPLIDLRLAARATTAGAHAAAFLVGAGVFYLLGFVIVLVQANPDDGPGLGASVSTAGLILVPYAIASVLGSRGTVAMSRWVRQEVWLPVGGVMYLIATGSLALFHEQAWQVLAAMLFAGLGSGCTFAAIPGLIVRAVPPSETGSALALNTVLRYMGFSLGSVLVVFVIEMKSPAGSDLSDAAFSAALLVEAIIWLIAIVTTLLTVLRRPTSNLNHEVGGT